jgi:outer membrane protein assembly factor BamB
MGQVWLGQDTQLDEYVAIKVLNSDVAKDAVSLLDLKREVQKSRKLSHDNIIRIHDLVQLPGENPFISLEYVEGTDLHAIQLNQPDRIFQWAEVKPYVLQLCEALDYAHERKIVHRDLKPPNIMIAKDGVLKLADFGIAASITDASGRSSMANIISGTPQFMSPQQMLGKSPKASDDIYALGATIYDLLTGRPPFHTGDIAQQVHHVTPAPIEQRLAEFGLQNPVPDYVNSVVLSCLAKDPEARPTSAGAIAEWIRTEGKSDSPAKRKKTKTGVEKITPEEPIQAEAETPAPVEAQPQEAKGKKTPVLAIAAVAAIAVIAGVLFLGKSGDQNENQNQGDGPQAGGKGGTEGQPATAAQMQAKLKDGLVAYYPFNGNANDESGKGHDGEVKGATLSKDRHNADGKAYSFDGKSWIELPQSENLKFGANDFTYCAWFNTSMKDPVTGRSALIVSEDNNQNPQRALSLGWVNGIPRGSFGVRDNAKEAAGLTDDKNKVADSRWHQLIGIRAGSTFKLAIDGKIVSVEENSEVTSSDAGVPIRIGARAGSPMNPFLGLIDDVRIYNRAFSDGEIAALYDLEKPSSETASGTKKPGTLLWEFETGGRTTNPAIGTDGAICIGSSNGKVYSLDGKTGAKKWEFVTGRNEKGVQSPPTVGADGTIYIGEGLGGRKFYALDGRTGTKKWEYVIGNYIASGPAIGADGTVYIGAADFKVHALDGRTGAKKWEFATNHEVHSSLAVGTDGTVFTGSADFRVYAINSKTGAKKWDFLTGGEVLSNLAIGADGTVYVGSHNGKVFALDGKTGTKKWEFQTGAREDKPSPVIGSDGTVYFGSTDTHIYALDGKTGAKKWDFVTSSYANKTPAIGDDGTVYVVSYKLASDNVQALDGKTGAKKWEYIFKGEPSSPVIGDDGTLYIGNHNGSVYALATSSKGPAKSPWPMFGQNAQHTGRASATKTFSATPNSPGAAAAIEAAIRKAAGKPTGTLTKADLEKVTRLNLAGNEISDVSPLTGLEQLKQLLIFENRIKDVSALANLKQLEQLNLRNNQISDVRPLAGLKQLESLNLQSNPDLTKAQIAGLQKALPKCNILHNATK